MKDFNKFLQEYIQYKESHIWPKNVEKIQQLVEEDQFFEIRLQTIFLILKSLRDKWFRKSNKNVLSYCPFCFDAREEMIEVDDENKCDYCLINNEICSDNASDGLISELKDIPVKDLPASQYRKIINAFSRMLQKEIDKLNELFEVYRYEIREIFHSAR